MIERVFEPHQLQTVFRVSLHALSRLVSSRLVSSRSALNAPCQFSITLLLGLLRCNCTGIFSSLASAIRCQFCCKICSVNLCVRVFVCVGVSLGGGAWGSLLLLHNLDLVFCIELFIVLVFIDFDSDFVAVGCIFMYPFCSMLFLA
jgi:hypothetical protein